MRGGARSRVAPLVSSMSFQEFGKIASMKTILLLLACGLSSASALTEPRVVGPVPDSLRKELELDAFYQKHTAVAGFDIVGSAKVSDFAILEAAWILEHMLAGRDDILRAMSRRHVRLTVMAWNEYTTDVPEHRGMRPRVFWDRRARGLGGSPVSCAEENLLCFPGDPYSTENILIHEFAHSVHGEGLRAIDATFDSRLRAAYESAIKRGLWKGTYAAVDRSEYWAEGVQDWFDNNRENDSLHNHVNTRAELKEYDPDLAKLCAEVFGENPWRYLKPRDREPADVAHLAGFDAAKAPRFRWREEAVPESPRVLVQTELGDIELELDAKRAPITAKNFLRYAHEGFYADGSFFRTVTLTNQPKDDVKIQVVQVEADRTKEKEFLPPIKLERTSDTGLRHLDGTVSMARDGPDTARDSFFICIGDQPELDFGGKRNPDGQGFAAFGKVVKGMDVVRKIHAAPAEGQKLAPPVRIQRAVRLN
jgi:cyclophilin family peptidyl-prolyl cis-trans isomerase